MARSKETVGKKEKEKKKAKNKQEKEERRQERKSNNNKGKSLEDMMAYIDEYGNISSTPPDPSRKKIEINLEDIQLGARPVDEQVVRKGVITFFNQDKGYGFINDLRTQESIFVHANSASEPLKEKDKVNFEVEHSPRGLTAINVVKIK